MFLFQSRLDDPVMWGFKGFPTSDASLARWALAAQDICFKNTVLSYFFRLGVSTLLVSLHTSVSNLFTHSHSIQYISPGKCIPITRGGGIYQEHMNEALDRLSDGEWVFYLITFHLTRMLLQFE